MGLKGERMSNLSLNFGNRFSLTPCLVLAIGLYLLENVIPGVIYKGFAYPAAYIASLFYGTHPMIVNGEILIAWNTGQIEVTPDCAGYGFFCLIWAMIFMSNVGSSGPWKFFTHFLFSALSAYVIAVIANAMRIISAYKVYELSGNFLPPQFQATLHMGVGISVFLPVLIVVFLSVERRCRYECSKI